MCATIAGRHTSVASAMARACEAPACRMTNPMIGPAIIGMPASVPATPWPKRRAASVASSTTAPTSASFSASIAASGWAGSRASDGPNYGAIGCQAGGASTIQPALRPYPPPPGVSITNTSPGDIEVEPMWSSRSTRPSARSTRLMPGLPGEPPAIPNAPLCRPLDRIDAVIGSRNRTRRMPPSPPRCSPSPPEPWRIS